MYRTTTDCVFICIYLVPYNSAEFISSSSFLVNSLGFSVCWIMSSVIRDSLLLLFRFGFLLFLFRLSLLWLKLPKLCWITVVRVGNLVLFLILEEMVSVFHYWEWCCLWVCHIWSLLCWGKFPLCLHLERFYHKWVLNFVKSFFCIYWDDHMVFLLQFVNMVYHID